MKNPQYLSHLHPPDINNDNHDDGDDDDKTLCAGQTSGIIVFIIYVTMNIYIYASIYICVYRPHWWYHSRHT
jgi:hypothetical protein